MAQNPLSGFPQFGDDTGEMEDRELIRNYAIHRSDNAFTELVKRHLGLVYSTALRRLGDPQTAEEVTQTVFTLLAQKARSLGPHVILAGWLYQTTCFKAAQRRRVEYRRLKREQEAAAMQHVHSSSETEAAWDRIEPLLDDAMQQLGERDRAAILLRFFQRKPFREVGLALGVEEEAARKRVDRALTRLRDWFASRGVAYPTASLAALLLGHAAQAAPGVLAATLSAAALQSAAGRAGTSTLANIVQVFTAMKLKTVLITTGIVLLGALVAVQRHNRPRNTPSASAAPPLPASSLQPAPQPSPTLRRFEMLSQVRRAEEAADDSLRAALVRLKEALHAPPGQDHPMNDPAREILYAIPLEQRAAALEMVMEALRDPNQHVCLRAIGLVPLIWPQGETALPTLFDLVRVKSAEWPELASTALIAATQTRSEPDIVPELVAAAMQGSARAHRALVAQLPLLKSLIPGSEAVFAASLQPFLYSFEPEARLTAAQALAQLPGPKDPAVVAELVSAVTAPADGTPANSEQTPASLNALQQMGPDAVEAIPALLEFGEQNPAWADTVNLVLKAVAPEELKGVGVPTPLPPLDPVSASVVRGIEEGTITVPGLAAALENPTTALYAARALAEFGPAASEALPSLERALESALRTNLSAALVLGATIERLDPESPKPLLLPMEVIPALEAVQAEAQRSNHPDWNHALETLSRRVPLGMAFQHEDVRKLAAEFNRIDPSLQRAFIGKLLESDQRFGLLFEGAP